MAGVVTEGGEANEGGDGCDVDESRIARSVTSLLIARAWLDDRRIWLPLELFGVPIKKLCVERMTRFKSDEALGAI